MAVCGRIPRGAPFLPAARTLQIGTGTGWDMTMYKHILIATDGSDLAKKAAGEGFALAKSLGAKVTAVTVTEQWSAISMAAKAQRGTSNPVEAFEQHAQAAADRILRDVAAEASSRGVTCATVHVKDREPAEGIIDAAKTSGCDLIVMASHGRRGLSRLLLGSQAARVVTASEVPVLVCR